MTHAVLVPNMIAAMNIDSLNRNVIDYGATASNVDNGNVFEMVSQHTSGSYSEVWEIQQPDSASSTDLWMAYSGDEVVLTASKYKGLDPDPRNFYSASNTVFSAYKPQKGDIITLTADAFSNSYSSHTYAMTVADAFTLTWTNDAPTAGLYYKYIDTVYISLATGGIDNQRVTAYKLECVSI